MLLSFFIKLEATRDDSLCTRSTRILLIAIEALFLTDFNKEVISDGIYIFIAMQTPEERAGLQVQISWNPSNIRK